MTTPAKFDAFRQQLTAAFNTFMERPRPLLDRLTPPSLTKAQKKQRACLILETTEVSARITALEAENATLQAKIGFMQTELDQTSPACSTCGATDHKAQSVCSNGFHAPRAHELSAQLKSLEAELAEAKEQIERERKPWRFELITLPVHRKQEPGDYPDLSESYELSLVDTGHSERVYVLGSNELDKRIKAAEAALATVEKCRHDMSALLARIHGDGGHYESDHGTQKAITDAGELVANLRTMLSESKESAKG